MMHQRRCAIGVLKRFNMINFNSTTSLSEVGLMLEKEGIEE